MQDATNLTNLLMAIGGDTLEPLAAAAKNVRNDWAHQNDMDQATFARDIAILDRFQKAMPLQRSPAAEEAVAVWDEVLKQIEVLAVHADTHNL